MKSLPDTSTRLPAEANTEMPSPRRAAEASTARISCLRGAMAGRSQITVTSQPSGRRPDSSTAVKKLQCWQAALHTSGAPLLAVGPGVRTGIAIR